MPHIVQIVATPRNGMDEDRFVGPFDSEDAADAFMALDLDKPPYAVWEIMSPGQYEAEG